MPAKATARRILIVERDYEPSRIWRQAMASSYEILIPIAKAGLERRRGVVPLLEERRDCGGANTAAGGSQR